MHSQRSFKVAEAATSRLVNVVSSRQTGFECEHPFIDKWIFTTEPPSARLPPRFLEEITYDSLLFHARRLLNLTTYRKIPKISPGAYIFQRLFSRGLSTEGNLRFKIDWASLIVGRKFTVFALF